MKVIDLLNKIANGEVEQDIEFFYKKEKYRHIDNLFGDYYVEEVLNDEVEIVEPKDIEVCGTLFTKSEYNKLFKEDKKIEKIPKKDKNGNIYLYSNEALEIIDKINEIIDKINEGD